MSEMNKIEASEARSEALENLRKEIDVVDAEIADLLAKRMEQVAAVADIKSKENILVRDLERERKILSRLKDSVEPSKLGRVQMLFSTIFDVSRSYQSAQISEEGFLARHIKEALEYTQPSFPKQELVACQGVEGSYSSVAADRLFKQADIMYFKNFEGVFSAVDKGLCRYGVLPIENSSHGSVAEVYDLMRERRFSIVRSTKIHIRHALLVNPGTKLGDIKAIYSHDQAIGQCSKFLATLSDVEVVLYKNTASAAKMVHESSRTDVAAISSPSTATLYGLEVLSEDIQNEDNNYTRFICISKNLEIFPGANKVSMLFSVSHKPGALYEMIAQFSVLGINLTKLESRPIPGSDFEFLFYIDVEADLHDEEVILLLDRISQDTPHFEFLGAYQEV